MAFLNDTGLTHLWSIIKSALGNKVDKVSGKGLSTNDYTTAEKNKLAGIAAGANVNQNAFSNVTVGSTTVAADSTTDTLTLVAGSNVSITPDATNDKITISATVPTKVSQLTNDSGYKTTDNNTTYSISKSGSTITLTGSDGSTSTVSDANTTYGAATTSAAGLMSVDDKKKLNGVASGAEVNQNAFSNVVVGSTTVAADSKTDTLTLVAGSNVTLTPDATNDKITIASKDTVYTHPSYSAKSAGLYKVTVDGTGHVSAATAVTKSDITALGIPASDTNTWRPVVDNLTSTATDSSLSANQGKVLKGLIDGKSASGHTHDDRYYTESEMDTKLSGKSDAGHTHDSRYYTEAEIDSKLSGKANTSHGTHVPSTCTTITDWNNATTNGWYMGSNISNQPVSNGGWFYGMTVVHNSNYIRQVAWHFASDNSVSGTNNDRYERVKNNGTWGGWVNTSVRKAVPSNAKFTDTTYSAATTSAAGLMSASDKSKLDGITASADAVSFSRSLTSGTKVGTLTINGTGTDLYAPTNTDTHYTTGLKVGASNTATANAAASNGSVYLNVLDNSTVRDSHKITGSGATSVTSDANGVITISSTNTTYNTATTSANGLMSSGDKSKLDGIATGATKVVVDSSLSTSSANPVQNKLVTTEINSLKTLVGSTAVSTQITNGTKGFVKGLSVSGQTVTYTKGDGSSGTITTQDTKNTAGSTDTSSRIYLIGATSQATNPQTYSDNEVYATSGVLTTKKVQVGGTAATIEYDNVNECINFVFA